jgi:hypothetical protein
MNNRNKQTNSATPDGYNPLRQNRRKSFNSDTVFTETVTQTDEQIDRANQIALIKKTFENLD